jgi:(E)-4-hydroxy-3-methylbut-2-enyl-diphosphate synthase
VYVDGRLMTTLKGDRIVAEFLEILNTYVDTHYAEIGEPAIARAVPAAAELG